MTVLQNIAASRKRIKCTGTHPRYATSRNLLVLLATCALACVTTLAHAASLPRLAVPPELFTIVITATAVYGGGEASNAQVILTVGPRPEVSALANAKSVADGEIVSVAGLVATSTVGDFADFFYIEEVGRTCGIRVAAPPSSVSGLSRQSVVDVLGTLATTADGERQISMPTVTVVDTAEPIGPLAMRNAWVGGGDAQGQPGVYQWRTVRENGVPVKKWLPSAGLNNVGMLVQTWGKVTEVGTDYMLIDDGSGPITVDTSTLGYEPVQNSYVTVVGLSSLYNTDSYNRALLLPRGSGDVSVQ